MSASAQPLTIKICGLSTPETLEAALAAGAEMIGLVFHPKSPRFVPPEEAATLAAMARGRAEIVALVVDREIGELTDLVAAVRPDWLQLHGRETPETVRAVKAATGLRAIKALGVADRHDLAAFAAYEGVADRILLDAKPPKDAAYPGGHGRAFDWSILAALDRTSPFMLSGGLDPANVAQAIAIARPRGVDVSSGVERAPGVKDVDRITDFVVAARAAAATATEAGRT
ncbi:phosphoribosylanthranilate isomerase [Bosea sp. OAE506]|uniref:phosphoribosylanthranilate isomerase n=1 Tax=Bosea sp. OAE506 TaxID=2663870 RepID=UPI001789342A